MRVIWDREGGGLLGNVVVLAYKRVSEKDVTML